MKRNYFLRQDRENKQKRDFDLLELLNRLFLNVVRDSIDQRVEFRDSEGEGIERNQDALGRLGPRCKDSHMLYSAVWTFFYKRELKDFKRRNENQLCIYNGHSSNTVRKAIARARP